MKIGIYGGSFNPPHLGHFEAAKTAVEVLGLDKLLLIPTAVPPHKEQPENTPDPKHRLAMAELMADGLQMPGVAEVCTLELERGGKSYTAQTLAELAQQYPGATFWLMMGTDMFLTLHLWREPEVIMKHASICAFGRKREDEELFAPQREHLHNTYHADVTTITLPNLVEISSTDLRAQLERGEGGKYLLPAVYGYILRNGLYGTAADLKNLDAAQLRACSLSMVRAKRIPHIIGVEEEAVRLAKHWGGDENSARRAGILHDCTKYWTVEEHFALCRKYGVELDEVEQTAEKLLHAKTGACIARHIFGESDAIYQAILWHTTGREDMSLLEKIIYVADYMEPNRDFDGVERLRKLAYTDLDKALLLGIETTIEEMQIKKRVVHNNTLACREWLLAQGVTVEESD